MITIGPEVRVPIAMGDIASPVPIEPMTIDDMFGEIIADTNVAKVSVVGIGMRSHTGVAATMFRALRDEGINIRVITTSEIKISILIDGPYAELAVRTLHSVYGLDKS